MTERRIAFAVAQWSSDATLYSWTWTKQFFLRRQSDQLGKDTLSPLDKLFVVHIKQGRDKDATRRWDAGGPLLPSLQTALANYPHQLVELEQSQSVHGTLLEFFEKNNMDIMILGSREDKKAVNRIVTGNYIGSVSAHLYYKAACLIVRPGSARTDKMRIKSEKSLTALMEEHLGHNSLPQGLKASMLGAMRTEAPRKVAVAYDTLEAGRQMLAWAARFCLQRNDELHLVQYSKTLDKKMSIKQMSMTKGRQSSEGEEREMKLAAEDLSDLSLLVPVAASVCVKGDAKEQVMEYLEAESIDLLMVGSAVSSRLRKALGGGGGVGSHLVHHAACPVLVLPVHTSSFMEANSLTNSQELAELELGGGSPPDAKSVKPAGGSNISTLRRWPSSGISRHAEPGPIAATPAGGLGRSSEQSNRTSDGGDWRPTSPQIELVARLQRQLQSKDAEITALKEQILQLQAAAQHSTGQAQLDSNDPIFLPPAFTERASSA